MIRRGLIAFAVVAILGAIGLVLAGGSDRRDTAFSAAVPNVRPVLALSPGQQACQGPMPVPAAFGAVAVWVAQVRGATALSITVTRSGVPSPSGSARASRPARLTVRLNNPVPAGSTVSVCFRDSGPGAESLVGFAPSAASGSLHANGQQLQTAAAMLALTPRSRSLLSELPTVFRRAALFRPTWIGAWTFWVMLAGLIAAAGLMGVALVHAARDEP